MPEGLFEGEGAVLHLIERIVGPFDVLQCVSNTAASELSGVEGGFWRPGCAASGRAREIDGETLCGCERS